MSNESKKTPIITPRRRRPQWAVGDSGPDAPAARLEDRYHSRTIERALDVLEVFGPGSAISLKQISTATGQPEASLYRVLVTLQSRGYLTQNPDGTYELAHKILYGRILDLADTTRAHAHPVLDELVQRFDETASLSYSFGNYIQVLDSVETFQDFRIANRPGRIIPPHCSAMGKAILAFQTDAAASLLLEAYGMARKTEHSIGDRQALRDELERVRKQGWACDREESTLGGICFAAPILDGCERAVGALSVSTPVQRMTQKREGQIREAVHQAAQRVTRSMQSANGKTIK